MSILRIIGLVMALACFAIVFFQLRRYRQNRNIPIVMAFSGCGMLLVSIFPGLVDYPATLFVEMPGAPFSRLLTLLLLSTFLLWVFYIASISALKARIHTLEAQHTDAYVREFVRHYQDLPRESVCVLIPAFNEEDNIGTVLAALPEEVGGHPVIALVVDDGSADGTAETAARGGAYVVTHLVNQGGGAAIKTGFAIARRFSPIALVTMDADGQHDPKEMPLLVEPILAGRADVVIGSRMLGSCDLYSSLRMTGIKFFSRMINLLINTRITDCSSGFRAIKRDVFERSVLKQQQYHTAELIIESAKRGFKIQEVPVYIRARASGVTKKGGNLRYAFGFLRSIVRTWLR